MLRIIQLKLPSSLVSFAPVISVKNSEIWDANRHRREQAKSDNWYPTKTRSETRYNERVSTLSWSEEENVKSLRHMDRRDAFNKFHHYSETYAKFYIHKEGGSPEEIKIKWINNRIRSKNTQIQVDNMQIL